MTDKLSPRLTTQCGFRTIRTLSIDDNLRRFKKHVERLGRHPEVRLSLRRLRAKRRARSALLAAQGVR